LTEKKKPQDWTTKEAIRRLFPKPIRDALEEVVTDRDDIIPDTDKPRKKPTGER
jgi:hypothetical protein